MNAWPDSMKTGAASGLDTERFDHVERAHEVLAVMGSLEISIRVEELGHDHLSIFPPANRTDRFAAVSGPEVLGQFLHSAQSVFQPGGEGYRVLFRIEQFNFDQGLDLELVGNSPGFLRFVTTGDVLSVKNCGLERPDRPDDRSCRFSALGKEQSCSLAFAVLLISLHRFLRDPSRSTGVLCGVDRDCCRGENGSSHQVDGPYFGPMRTCFDLDYQRQHVSNYSEVGA